MDTPLKKFSWSWTKVDKWRTCPKKHYHLDVAKDFREEVSEALSWGRTFHEAMAARVEKGTLLHRDMAKWDRWPGLMRSKKEEGCEYHVELSLAMTSEFTAAQWFGQNTWCRGIVDVLAIDGDNRYAVAVDWKTGKNIEPNTQQLGVNAQLVFANYPDVNVLHTTYFWSKHDALTPTVTYERDKMVELWSKLLPEVKQIEESVRVNHYPPKPSGLCIRHCPVTTCPYHGKGSR